MVSCSHCSSILREFRLCMKCGRSYCPRHRADSCPLCKIDTTGASAINRRPNGGPSVTWILVQGMRIGLVDFNRVPNILSNIVRYLVKGGESLPFQIILFPNKDSSAKFAREMTEKETSHHQPGWSQPEGSRYTLWLDRKTGQAVALINVNSLKPDAVDFVMSFLRHLTVNTPLEFNEGAESVVPAVVVALTEYNSKFGIPFVSEDAGLIEACMSILNGLHFEYSHYAAFRQVVSDENASVAADFLQYRLNLVYGYTDWENIDYLFTAFEFLWKRLAARTIVYSVSHVPGLKEIARNQELEALSIVKTRLIQNPDIVAAMEAIEGQLDERFAFLSRESYVAACSRAFVVASRLLLPRYMRFEEIGKMMAAANAFCESIEQSTDLPVPSAGPFADLLKVLGNMLEKDNVFPEIPILAGTAAFEITRSLALSRHDFLAYQQASSIGQRLTNFTEAHLDEIRRKHPPRGEDPGTSLTEIEMISPLLGVAALARLFGEVGQAETLENQARTLADKHNVLSMKVLLDWRDYLRGQDTHALQAIYRNFHSSNLVRDQRLNPLAVFVGHLACGVLDAERRNYHFEKAEDIALDFDIVVGGSVSQVISSNGASVSLHTLNIFKALFDAAESDFSENTLTRLSVAAKTLLEDASPLHIGRSIALRSLCLCALLKRDLANLRRFLDQLAKFASSQGPITEFREICQTWMATDRVRSRLMRGLRHQIDTRDPWNEIALRFLNSELASQLRGAELLDYYAIVFVEGPDDARIFRKWAHRMCKPRLLFVPMEGWTNMDYYANGSVVSAMKKPCFVIFDGDTSGPKNRSAKEKLLAKLRLDHNRIITLNRNSIEAYLVKPKAIKAAYPSLSVAEGSIRSYFARFKNKKNQKETLRLFFERFTDVPYDGSVGARIADRMSVEEVDPEIRQMFKRIEEEVLENLTSNVVAKVSKSAAPLD